METLHYGHGSMAELEAAVWEYNKEVGDGIISPCFTPELYIETFGPKDRLIFAWEGEKIRGFLNYMIRQPGDVEKYDPLEKEMLLRLFGSERWDSEKIVSIKFMESFQRGTGRALMDALKSHNGIEGIYLISFLDAHGFYEKMGFEDSSINIYRRPLMVWKRPAAEI